MNINITAERKMFSDDFRKRLSPTYNNASDEYVTVILCKPEFEAWLRRAALAAPQQGPKAWVRLRAGEIDWAEDCLYPHPSDYDEDVYDAEDEVTFAPVYIGAPPTTPVLSDDTEVVGKYLGSNDVQMYFDHESGEWCSNQTKHHISMAADQVLSNDDLWHIACLVTELNGGSLFNVSQQYCVTAIRASFMDPDSGRALLAKVQL